jgi:hypothetical protein
MSLTVANFVAPITQKLGNRNDLTTVTSDGTTPLYEWVAAGVRELTDNYQFEELRVTGPKLAFTVNNAEYAKNFFTNPVGAPPANEDWTDVVHWFLEIDPTSGIGWPIEYRDVMVVDPMSKIKGPPVYWTQHGETLIVGLKPDKAYNTYWRYQKRHVFTTPVAATDPILMPLSWFEVISVAGALRGAIDKRAVDYIKLYDTILNGDEEYYRTGGKVGKPGMIFGLVSQQRRNRSHNSRQLAPVVSRY